MPRKLKRTGHPRLARAEVRLDDLERAMLDAARKDRGATVAELLLDGLDALAQLEQLGIPLRRTWRSPQ